MEYEIDGLKIMVSECERCNGTGVVQGLLRWDYSYDVHPCPTCDPIIMLDGSVYDPFPAKVEPKESALARITSGLIMTMSAVAALVYLGVI